MATGTADGTRVAYIAESAFGTTPSTPTFQVLRTTNAGLATNKLTGTSQDLRADGNVPDEFLLGMDVEGSYNFELSYGTLDDILAGALAASWSTNVLKNGMTPKFFTFEETIELGSTDSFSRFVGCMVDSFTLDITARQAITGSFGLIGKSETLATAIISGATYTAANTKAVMTGAASVGALTVGSISPAPLVRRLQLQINRNLRRRTVVNSLYTDEPGVGRCDVTGNLECYFASNALYQAVLDHDTIAIETTLGTVTSEKYTIEIPSAKLGSGRRVVGGNGSDIMVNIPFRGLYNSSDAASIVITRAVS